MNVRGMRRAGLALLALVVATGGCAGGGGGLGGILGSVLGGQGQQGQQGQGQRGEVRGTVRGVDQRRIALQLTDGQQVALAYDQQTTVEYQSRRYEVANLEPGDRVTALVQETGNGAYYVRAVRVDQSVQEAGGAGGGQGAGSDAVQAVQGVVRQVDVQNGLFALDVGNGRRFTVSMPYNVSRADNDRFRALRPGDQVRFYGAVVNSTRIELRQFY